MNTSSSVPTMKIPTMKIPTGSARLKPRLVRFAIPTSILLAAILPTAAVSQAPIAPTSASPPPPEEVIELSPFEVSSDRDVGFVAAQSLAGGRLASDLKDTPAAYSVITQEFIEALGIIDLADAVGWTTNATEGIEGTYGVSDIWGNPHTTVNIRGASSAMNKPQRNFFPYNAPNDSYAVERYDFGRGPNSILFGNSSLGGVSSAMTKQAKLDRRFGALGLTMGSWDYRRATFDMNQPLGERVALRLAGVDFSREGWRPSEFEKRRALFLTTTFKLARNTTLRVEGETGDWSRRTPAFRLVERISGWDGVTTFSGPVTTLPKNANALGISRLGPRPIYYPFGPVNAVMNYQNQAITLSGGANAQVPIAGYLSVGMPAFGTANPWMLNSPNIPANRYDNAIAGSAFRLPSDTFNMGATDVPMVSQDFHDLQVTLDHKIGPFYMQFAADTNKVVQLLNHMDVRGAGTIFIDINKLLPDGTPNPKFLEPYSDANLREVRRWNRAEGLRFALGTQYDGGRWGRYVFSAQAGVTETTDFTSPYNLSIAQHADPRLWGTDVSQIIQRRSYLNDTTRPWPIDALQTIRYIDPMTGTQKLIDPIFAIEGAPTLATNRFRYALASANGRFWNDRIIALAALRVDSIYGYTKAGVHRGDLPMDWDGQTIIWKSQEAGPGWGELTYSPKNAAGVVLGPPIPAQNRPRAGGAGNRLAQYAGDVFKDDTNAPVLNTSKVTSTVGTVLRPFSWLDAHINYAETFNASFFQQRIDSSFFPATVVKGFDIGLRTALFKGRLNLNVGYYSNKELGAQVGQPIVGPVNNLLSSNAIGDFTQFGLNKRGIPLLVAFIDSRDREAKGFEGELTANLMKGWRLTANFGLPKTYEVDSQRDSRKYLEDNLQGSLRQVAEDAGVIIDSSNRATVDTSIPINERSPNVNSAVNAWNQLIIIQQNFATARRTIGDQPNANLFTDYTIQGGRLKGLRLGAGVQWRAGPIIGFRGADTIVDPADPTKAIDDPTVSAYTPVYAPRDSFNAVATLGYTLRLANKRQIVFNLRINNLLDRRGVMRSGSVLRPTDGDYTQPARVTVPEAYSLLTPINYTLSATMKF